MFKVLLTEEQWSRVANMADDDILLAMVEAQPELAKRLGVEAGMAITKRPGAAGGGKILLPDDGEDLTPPSKPAASGYEG